STTAARATLTPRAIGAACGRRDRRADGEETTCRAVAERPAERSAARGMRSGRARCSGREDRCVSDTWPADITAPTGTGSARSTGRWLLATRTATRGRVLVALRGLSNRRLRGDGLPRSAPTGEETRAVGSSRPVAAAGGSSFAAPAPLVDSEVVTVSVSV